MVTPWREGSVTDIVPEFSLFLVVVWWWAVLGKSKSMSRRGDSPVVSGREGAQKKKSDRNIVIPLAARCQLPAGTMAWLEGMSADVHTEKIVSLTNQSEGRSRIRSKTTCTKSDEMYQTRWTYQSVTWIIDEVMLVTSGQILKQILDG